LYCFAGYTNLALNKQAVQTDTRRAGVAEKAVDGNTNGGSCSRTKSFNATWEVDLGDQYVIKHVIIYSRLNVCKLCYVVYLPYQINSC